MKWFILFIVLVCLSVGCASGEQDYIYTPTSDCSFFAQCYNNNIKVIASEDFNAKERKVLQQGLNNWENVINKPGNVLFTFELSFVPNDQLLAEQTSNVFYVYRRAPAKTDLNGTTNWSFIKLSAHIELMPDFDGDMLSLYTHEIGHALHLPHYVGDGSSVMYSNKPGVISQADIEEINFLWRYQGDPRPINYM